MTARVRMLGPPAIIGRDSALDLSAGKTSALLCYLAYRRDWVERETLVGLLYPESEERRARQNLRALIARTRRHAAAEVLDVEPTRLRWRVASDVTTFQEALSGGRWAAAVETYGGPFLDGFVLPAANAFQEWQRTVREELARGWRAAALELASRLREQGRYRQAARLAERVLDHDPFDEEALRERLVALMRNGDRAAAMAAYEAFAARLAEELDVGPAEATVGLAEAIRRGDGEDATRRGTRTGPAESHENTIDEDARRPLPQPVAPFIGRDRELAWLEDRMSGAGCRLVTLVGPGGIGKTALALAFGRRLERAGGRRVVFAPLETAGDVEGAALLIGDALGLSFYGPDSSRRQVLAALHRRSDVLILDNVEQIPNVAAFIHEILEDTAAVGLLTTSRERLDLRAEWVLEVEGLAYQDGPPADAARLFDAAATRVDASYEPARHRRAVERICRLVGGMPLALELAAGWLPVLAPSDIAERLEDDLDLLRGEAADRPARHRGMDAVLEESWQRLTPAEREGLARLAVFEGGFTAQAAEAVAGAGTEQLRALRRRALLQRGDDGRFSWHPLVGRNVRRRAAEADSWEALRERHATYFAGLLERIGAADAERPDNPHQAQKPELPNALSAWNWMVDRGRVDLLGRSLEGLAGLAMVARAMSVGARAVARAVDVTSDDGGLRVRLLRAEGELLTWLGDYDRALEPLQASLRLAEQLDDRHEEGLALFALGLCLGFDSKAGHEALPNGSRHFSRCIEIFRQEGDRYHEARALVNLATTVDDPLQREALFRSAIEAFRSCDGTFGVTHALSNLARTLHNSKGDYAEACALLDEAVEIERSVGLRNRLAWWLAVRADMLLDRGRLDEAELDVIELERIMASLGAGFGEWENEHAAIIRGRLQLERGRSQRASETFGRVTRWRSGVPDPFGYRLMAQCWQPVAERRAKRWERAERLASDALQAPEWSHTANQFTLGPFGVRVGGVLVEAGVRRDDKVAASLALASALAIVKRFRLLPSALELCLAGARLSARTGPAGSQRRLLSLAAHHPAASAHTRTEARRRLARAEPPERNAADEEPGPLRGGSRGHGEDTPPPFESVLDALEVLTMEGGGAPAGAALR